MDCGAFTLWWLERPVDAATAEVTGPRVCVVASIAAVGKAVLRTRAKRRLRELFRIHQSRVPAGLDLMLIAKSGCVKWDYSEMERRFVQACERLSKPKSAASPAAASAPRAETRKPGDGAALPGESGNKDQISKA